MKSKTTKRSPIHTLYMAAKEIVDGTRRVFAENGQDAREIRVPILIHGTDMRITLEAGPKIAARNAIEEAQSKASGKPAEPTVDMSQALNEARTLLETDAQALKQAHTVNGEWPKDEPEAHAAFQRYMAAIRGLNELERLI